MSDVNKKSVLFLCTGNSCRSQMAEGIVRHFLGQKYHVYSAGLAPSFVHPQAIEAMKEIDIDISNHSSKHLNDLDVVFDLVITLCGSADETCPAFAKTTKVEHIPFEDPAKAVGDKEQIADFFRKVRDQIKARLLEYLQ